MGKVVHLDFGKEEELVKTVHARSFPVRLRILELVNTDKLSIADIARRLQIPASSAALHIRELQEANLVRIEMQPGTRGSVKLCTRAMDKIDIRLTEMNGNVSDTLSVDMPIGAYTDCQGKETCGIADADGIIGSDDEEETFFLPERLKAQMLWTSAGYVEYQFPNKLRTVPFRTKVTSIAVCMEICSEAAGYQDNWKSDITLWINGKDCGTFTSPGDFGSRRGKNNPPSWGAGRTQYGLLTTWTVTDEGSFVNDSRGASTVIDDLDLLSRSRITVRIGNREDACNVGGFNLFGRAFGDDDQDIVLRVTYLPASLQQKLLCQQSQGGVINRKTVETRFFPQAVLEDNDQK